MTEYPTPEQVIAGLNAWQGRERPGTSLGAWGSVKVAKMTAALVAAAGAALQEPSLSDAADTLRENAREIEDAQLAEHGMIDPISNAVIAGIRQSAAMVCELAGSQVPTVVPVQVDEAKLAEV